MFKNRTAAGIALSEKLQQYKNTGTVIMAVPKGGIPVANAVANILDLPMEILFSKKLRHPYDREYIIGTVSLRGNYIIPNEGVPAYFIHQEITQIRKELNEMQMKLMHPIHFTSLKHKTVILVDDWIATGRTLLGLVNILKTNGPAKIIVATPLASKKAMYNLMESVDKIIYIESSESLTEISDYYEDFSEVSDQEIANGLSRVKNYEKIAE